MVLSIRIVNLKGIDYDDYEPETQDIEIKVYFPLTFQGFLKMIKDFQ